jgi:hypothetical protein
MCNDIERPNIHLNTSRKISSVFYCEMKLESRKESYIDECTIKERMGIIWLKAGIRKLRGIKRESDRGRYNPGLGGGMLSTCC